MNTTKEKLREGWNDMAQRFDQMKAQRDELLAALKHSQELLQIMREDHNEHFPTELWNDLVNTQVSNKAAIAKVEGDRCIYCGKDAETCEHNVDSDWSQYADKESDAERNA